MGWYRRVPALRQVHADVFVSTLHWLAAQQADDLPMDDLSSDSLGTASMMQSGPDGPVFAVGRRVAM